MPLHSLLANNVIQTVQGEKILESTDEQKGSKNHLYKHNDMSKILR